MAVNCRTVSAIAPNTPTVHLGPPLEGFVMVLNHVVCWGMIWYDIVWYGMEKEITGFPGISHRQVSRWVFGQTTQSYEICTIPPVPYLTIPYHTIPRHNIPRHTIPYLTTAPPVLPLPLPTVLTILMRFAAPGLHHTDCGTIRGQTHNS